MPSVVHVVATANFAGVERCVSDVARETAGRGWDVAVVGGHPERMSEAVGGEVQWLPGATLLGALRSLRRVGRRDVCHSHMTVADAVAVAARPVHRAPVVSTRHFAARRGSSRAGRLLAPWIGRRLAREIAVSEFVASQLERRPDAVIPNGVALSPCLWRSSNQRVLVLQRLEPEKDTLTALRAWQASGLADQGWTLRVVGDGSERTMLERWAAQNRLAQVEFAGWTRRVGNEFASAGLLLASAPGEPFGLAVVEAMAAGVPVVASAAGGHLETAGRLPTAAMFRPGDIAGAAAALRGFLPESERSAASVAALQIARARFSLAQTVSAVIDTYEEVLVTRRDSLLGARTSVRKV